MSNETNETIEDIVADIRAQNQGLPEDSYALSPLVCDLLSFADRIEAAEKRADDQWRAAFAKIEEVVTIQYAKRNLGDKGKIAVAEIMSACRFPDGALDEYERAFAENARLRAALEVVKYALGESRIAICHICNIKHTCGHGTAKFDPCCIIKDIDSAIAAIRGVGGAK